MKRIVMVLLLSYSALTWARDSTGLMEWNEGVYEELPFLFPENLSKAEVRDILLLTKSLSTHEVHVISFHSKNKVTVKTCTHGIRKSFMCNAGETFLFQKVNNNWIEVPEQRSRWLQ